MVRCSSLLEFRHGFCRVFRQTEASSSRKGSKTHATFWNGRVQIGCCRKEVISEIGELLPTRCRFVVWENPLYNKQESIYTMRKFAGEIQGDDYPADIRIFRVEIRAPSPAIEDSSGSADGNLKFQAVGTTSAYCSTFSTKLLML